MTKLRFYPLLLIGLFTVFMVYPLWHVLLRALFVDGVPSLAFFRVMATTQFYREAVFNSLNLAILVTVITSLLAYPLALLLGRYQLPAARLLHALLLLPLVVPPFVGVLGVRQLFSRFGSVNVALLDLGLIERPINWLGGGGVVGIVALQVLHLVPILYLTLRSSLSKVHVTLEEAALMSGASRFQVLRSIVIPMSFPGWFAGATLVFIGSFTDLGTPLIFEYRKTVPVQIYNMLTDLNQNPVGYSFVVFTCVLCVSLFLLSKASLASGSYASSARIAEADVVRVLPPWARNTLTSLVFFYVIVSLLPQTTLLLLSLSGEWFMTTLPTILTLEHYKEVAHHPIAAHSLFTSLWLSACASCLTVVVGFLTASIVVRGRGGMRALFETFSIVPLAVPGIVFAFGYAGGFMGTPLDNRINPFPLLVAAYMIRRLPAMVRSAAAGLQEASQGLEEAGLMVGASPTQVARHIVLPLVRRQLVVGALLTFAYSMIEVSDGLLLALEERFYPVSKAIYALIARPDGLELAAALGVIVMAVMAIAFYATELVSAGARRRTLSLLAICSLLSVPSMAVAQVDEVVIASAHWEGMKREFEWGFVEDYKARTGRDVQVRWLDLGGVSDIIKYLKGQYRSNPHDVGVDLMFAGGTEVFLDLKQEGILQPCAVDPSILKAIPASLAGAPLYDPDGFWYSAALSTFGIVYNKVALARLGVPEPRSWTDLAHPEYFDLVGAGDPRKSGSSHAMFEVILQGYGWSDGWRLIQQIGGNVRNISGGSTQVGKEVATAEVAVGMAIDTYGGELIRRFGSDRVGFALPSDFPAVNGDGIAVLRNAPHRETASAFLQFVLSEQGQRIFLAKKGTPGGPRKFEIGKFSVVPSLYAKVDSAAVVPINPFSLSGLVPYEAELASRRWNLVNDLFGAFIVDSHEDLVLRTKRASAGGPPLIGIPIDEDSFGPLNSEGQWGRDPVLRSEKLREWGVVARGSRDGSWAQISWLPSAAVLALLIVLALRRRWRALS